MPENAEIPPEKGEPLDLELCLSKTEEGNKLDARCTSGQRGGTTFLPAESQCSAEVQRILNTTAHYIPTGIQPHLRQKELKNPRTIPIAEYNPRTSRHFWQWVEHYADVHKDDTVPRLLGITSAKNLDDLLATQKGVLGGEPSVKNLERFRNLSIPLFVILHQRREINAVLAKVSEGKAHGMIFNKPDLVAEAKEKWREHASRQPNPVCITRPFMGLKGSTKDLTRFMESSSDQEADTLVLTDTPSMEEAETIHRAHLSRMRRRKTSKKLDNPFNKVDREEKVIVAVINVQGSARMDAAALIQASGTTEFNVEVHLVENGDQLNTLHPDCIVLPGGWHGLQYKLQEELGLKDQIIQHIREKGHILALCAGSIQTRASDQDLDDIRSVGCEVGTTIGIGPYKVFNNALSNPHDLHVRAHSPGEGFPDSRILRQVPLSNAPYFMGVGDNMEIIARLRTDPRAASIDDDDGKIMGLQVQQSTLTSPVQMAAAFHDQFIYLLFLHEIGMFNLNIQHERNAIQRLTAYHRSEMEIDDTSLK